MDGRYSIGRVKGRPIKAGLRDATLLLLSLLDKRNKNDQQAKDLAQLGSATVAPIPWGNNDPILRGNNDPIPWGNNEIGIACRAFHMTLL